MRTLLISTAAALAFGVSAWAATPADDKAGPACDSASACPTQEYGPYRRSDLQPGDCGLSGLDCATTQFGPFRRI